MNKDPQHARRKQEHVREDTRRMHADMEQIAQGLCQALAAYTVALSRVVDRDRLAEALRLQRTSFTLDASDSKADRTRNALLEAAWRAVALPPPAA
jgi:hypothetical protein